MNDETPSYRDTVRELEEILEAIEGEDVDIDDLSLRVERAAELIRVCREKIARTEARVTRVVQGLEEAIANEGEGESMGRDAAGPDEEDGPEPLA